MDLATIAVITLIFTITIYLIFFMIGLGGIAKNKEAQGLDQKKNR
tara:strand:+ start:1837 stop:1971 length:135 start_codon:yes stop_codon:yes gene_type:complete